MLEMLYLLKNSGTSYVFDFKVYEGVLRRELQFRYVVLTDFISLFAFFAPINNRPVLNHSF